MYISVSAAMTMQNVVNPTFWERESKYRTDVLPVWPCSRNGYELCRINVRTTTVSREIVRNSNVQGVYGPRQAELKKKHPPLFMVSLL